MSTATAIAEFRSTERMIAERVLGEGSKVLLVALVDGPRFRIVHEQGSGRCVVYETTFPDEAMTVFDAFDGIDREWAPPYLPIGRSCSDKADLTVAVYAVGATALECVKAFLASKGEILCEEAFDPEHEFEGVFQWQARFVSVSSGTSFRAAGRIVPGGYVMTWWQ